MNQQKLLVLCGSAGSIASILTIVSRLDDNYPTPIVVLIHQQEHLPTTLHQVIQHASSLRTIVPEDQWDIQPHTIYVAPSGYHLQVEEDYTFSFGVDAPVHFSRPSIDVLLETAARVYQEHLTVVLLSGASDDGTRGITHVLESGGTVFVQDPQEVMFKTMLESAIHSNQSAVVLPLQEIINHIVQKGGPTCV